MYSENGMHLLDNVEVEAHVECRSRSSWTSRQAEVRGTEYLTYLLARRACPVTLLLLMFLHMIHTHD